MPRNVHGKPPDLYPEILQRLRQEIAAKTAAEQAVNPAAAVAKTQQEIQSSTASSAPNSNLQQISQQKSKDKKEKPAMPATVTTHAKAALRSKSPSRRSLDEGGSPHPSPGNAEAESSFERHSRKCTICNHPDREAIEELFINWHSPQSIRGLFAIYHPFDWSAVYRHARAAGLYAKRSKNLRAVLDLLLEGATHVKPTAHGVIAAVRAYSCLTEEHKWVEPEKCVHIVSEVYRHDAPAPKNAPTASATTVPGSPVEPAASSQSNGAASSTVPRPGTNPEPSPYICSPLTTEHSLALSAVEGPLVSNRQPTELESPLTHT